MSSQQPNNPSHSMASHGRGGAGNMAESSKSPRIQASDLETPVLKTAMVTTGRGGTGNMAKNTDPAETRLMQDVEAIPRGTRQTVQHSGRGGAGNIYKDDGEEEKEKDKEKAKAKGKGNAEQLAEEGAEKAKRWFFSSSKN